MKAEAERQRGVVDLGFGLASAGVRHSVTRWKVSKLSKGLFTVYSMEFNSHLSVNLEVLCSRFQPLEAAA